MSRVFIVQSPRRDDLQLDILGEYSDNGKYIKLIPDDVPKPPLTSADFAEMVINYADSYAFDSNNDYLAIVGSIATVSIAVGVLTEQYGPLKLLVYQASDKRYMPVDLLPASR